MLSLPEGILYIGIPARPDVFSSFPFPSGSVPALPVFCSITRNEQSPD